MNTNQKQCREEKVYLNLETTANHWGKSGPKLNQDLEAGLLSILHHIPSIQGSHLTTRRYNKNDGGKHFLVGLQASIYSASLLIQIRTTCLAMMLPTVGWTLLHLSLTKTIPNIHVHFDVSNFSVESFPPRGLWLCQVDRLIRMLS